MLRNFKKCNQIAKIRDSSRFTDLDLVGPILLYEKNSVTYL